MDLISISSKRSSTLEFRICAINKRYDEGADLKFKSIRKKTIQAKTQLTDATFRKGINRLEALQFINIVKNSKEHTVFITQYG